MDKLKINGVPVNFEGIRKILNINGVPFEFAKSKDVIEKLGLIFLDVDGVIASELIGGALIDKIDRNAIDIVVKAVELMNQQKDVDAVKLVLSTTHRANVEQLKKVNKILKEKGLVISDVTPIANQISVDSKDVKREEAEAFLAEFCNKNNVTRVAIFEDDKINGYLGDFSVVPRGEILSLKDLSRIEKVVDTEFNFKKMLDEVRECFGGVKNLFKNMACPHDEILKSMPIGNVVFPEAQMGRNHFKSINSKESEVSNFEPFGFEVQKVGKPMILPTIKQPRLIKNDGFENAYEPITIKQCGE